MKYTSGSNVIQVDVEKEMKTSFMDYSMSVIVSRALPDVRDGLKPVHRRILYTMYENGLTPDKPYRKCADTVGSVLGSYHPHGDASVYDAMVRLAQDFSLRYPLVDGHGNFGSVDGDPPAAYRYTESRLAKVALHMLTDIDKETVDFVPNYDDRKKEPSVLPARFPCLLVNGSSGIAVGMATNIPPHNLREVIDGVDCIIDNPDATLEELMQHIQGPDFPTGGVIMGRSGIRAAYGTGRGKITLRSRAAIEEDSHGRMSIVVTEIPYMVNKARLIESIADLVKEKRIEGISNIQDHSDRDGMRIVIDLKRDANAQVVLNQLYSYSQMQETVGVIMLALVDGAPKVLTLKEMLQEYLRFQREVITRRTAFELKKAKERAHVLEGLKIALDFIDEVISIIRSSKDIPTSKQRLMERFNFTDIQASAIVAMRLGQLSGLERTKIEEELDALHAKIAELEGILADTAKVDAIIKEELDAIREKYKDERRTAIELVGGEVDVEDLIPEEQCVVTLTQFGYIKRQPVDVYKSQRRGGRGISGMTRRDEDFVMELFVCSTHDYVMFFTNKGRVFRLKGYEVPESSRVSRGTNMVNLLPIEGDEKVTSMIRIPAETDLMGLAAGSETAAGYLTMVTRQGIIKRSRVEEYRNVRKGGLIAISLDEGDELAWVQYTEGDDDLIVGTYLGMAIRFNEQDARSMGRTARGVRAIDLEEGDQVVGMARVHAGATLLTVSEKGYGRRSEFSEYRRQSRGGKGTINYRVGEEKGCVAGIRSVTEEDDVIVITDDGVIIRFHADEVNVTSRYAAGVKVMRIAEGSKVVTLASTPREEAEDAEPSEPSEPSGKAEEAEAAEADAESMTEMEDVEGVEGVEDVEDTTDVTDTTDMI